MSYAAIVSVIVDLKVNGSQKGVSRTAIKVSLFVCCVQGSQVITKLFTIMIINA